VKPCESPDWFEWVQIALMRMALEQLSPEEERAVWLYAEGATLSPKQRTLAETVLQKIRRMLGLE
jgi:uncharacterized protein YqcC (DUF446 family)